MRHQDGLDCWAYGPAQMLEARLQYRDGVSVALDIEHDAYYWLIQDRLFNSYRRRKLSEGILNIAGYSADYLSILAVHGADVYHINRRPRVPDFDFPMTLGFQIGTKTWNNRVSTGIVNLIGLEKDLIVSDLTPGEAWRKIHSSVDQVFHLEQPETERTPWVTGMIPKRELLGRMLGPDAHSNVRAEVPSPVDGKADDPSAADFVFLTSDQRRTKPGLNGHWFRYDDDRFWAYGVASVDELLGLARLSMDVGWPVTLESSGHVMTGVGYHTLRGQDGHVTHSYAVIDADGTIFAPAGLSWQSEDSLKKVLKDITVFYPVVEDALPQHP